MTGRKSDQTGLNDRVSHSVLNDEVSQRVTGCHNHSSRVNAAEDVY